jgi:subfamily B ATP-binding cassette protein MsbA
MELASEQNEERKDFLRLLSYTRPYIIQLIGALICLLLATALGLAYPRVVQSFTDALFVHHRPDVVSAYGPIMIVIFIAQSGLGLGRSYLVAYVGENVLADIRKQIFGHLLNLPAAFFANRRTGELLSRSASDVGVIQGFSTTGLTELARQTLLIVGGIAMMALMTPKLTLMVLVIVPPMVVLANRYGKYVRRLSVNVQDSVADSNSVIQEAISAIPIVQLFVKEDYERKRYAEKIDDQVRLSVRRSVAGGGFVAFLMLVVYGGIGLVLWLGSRMVMAGTMSVGGLTAFLIYGFMVGSAASGVSGFYGQLQQALGSTRRVFELLDIVPTIRDSPDAQPMERPKARVEFRNVHFAYPGEGDKDDRKEVIKGINISTREGEIVALVGPSGAGKSTLVSLLPRFYDVTSGSILVDDQDIRSVRLADLRGAISAVPQETVLFSASIRENIAYVKPEATDEEIESVARAAHAHEFISSFPRGYSTLVGERGVKLSGGQRQRIAIARALLKDPALLVLDEATSSLDSESEELIQKALYGLMQGRTTFVIAHRLSTVRRAHRIIYLDDGEIVEEGTHEELLASNGKYARLCDIQFKDAPSAGQQAADAAAPVLVEA